MFMKYITNWRPCSIPHNKKEATEAVSFIKEQIQRHTNQKKLELATEIYEPQIQRAMIYWELTEREVKLMMFQRSELNKKEQ